MRSGNERFFSGCLFFREQFGLRHSVFHLDGRSRRKITATNPPAHKFPGCACGQRVGFTMRAMDEINQLASLGLVLPSPAYLAGAILFGLIGYVAFRRGRKTSTASLTWTGVA